MATNQERYQEITDKICSRLEAGKIPWKKPWHGEADCPTSIASGKPYKGINRIVLMCNFEYESPFYLTYNEAQRRGGYVRCGERGHIIYFWKWITVKDDRAGKEKSIPFIKIDYVYNLEQTENVIFNHPKVNHNSFVPIKHAQEIVSNWKDGPTISHHGDTAFYTQHLDQVTVPKPENFDTGEFYYQSVFHELTHSTGHSKRLNRFVSDKSLGSYGSEDYSREELVAELGAAFLCSECMIDNSILEENSVAYIQSWLKAFRDDPKMIAWAATRAQKSTSYILGEKTGNEENYWSQDSDRLS